MTVTKIVVAIDKEIAILQEVKQLLESGFAKSTTRGAKKKTVAKRNISEAGRARIAAAQRARWAKVKRARKAAQAA